MPDAARSSSLVSAPMPDEARSASLVLAPMSDAVQSSTVASRVPTAAVGTSSTMAIEIESSPEHLVHLVQPQHPPSVAPTALHFNDNARGSIDHEMDDSDLTEPEAAMWDFCQQAFPRDNQKARDVMKQLTEQDFEPDELLQYTDVEWVIAGFTKVATIKTLRKTSFKLYPNQEIHSETARALDLNHTGTAASGAGAAAAEATPPSPSADRFNAVNRTYQRLKQAPGTLDIKSMLQERYDFEMTKGEEHYLSFADETSLSRMVNLIGAYYMDRKNKGEGRAKTHATEMGSFVGMLKTKFGNDDPKRDSQLKRLRELISDFEKTAKTESSTVDGRANDPTSRKDLCHIFNSVLAARKCSGKGSGTCAGVYIGCVLCVL